MRHWLSITIGLLAIAIAVVAGPDRMHAAYRFSFALFGICIATLAFNDWRHSRTCRGTCNTDA
jgi:hypothetical protein